MDTKESKGPGVRKIRKLIGLDSLTLSGQGKTPSAGNNLVPQPEVVQTLEPPIDLPFLAARNPDVSGESRRSIFVSLKQDN